jgi:Holliday junction resolvasome RuvABC endonuclease subunit
MNILALDLGTSTGWAVIGRDGKLHGSTATFHPTGAHGAQRWLRFRQFLTDTRNTFGSIEVCYYEKVMNHNGVAAAHIYGAFEALLEIWAEVNNVRLVGVGVGTIKKHWTGKGNAKKEDMIAEAKRRGLEPVDDNHADAMAILIFAMQAELETV